MTTTTTQTRRALSLALATLVAAAMLSGPAAAAGPTALTVSAADTTLAPGETTTVTLAVDSANGGVGSADFRVELSDPTVASVTDVQVANDPPSSLTSVDVDGDGAGATVSYAFANSSADTGTVTVATVTLTADAAGSTDVNVVANPGVGALDVGDEDGQPYTLTSVGSASITVADENAPPTADAGADQTADEETTVTLDGTGSGDADGDTLSYAWTQTAGPSVSLDDASAAQPTFTAPDVSAETTLTFEVEVSDGTDATSDTVDVVVSPDTQPPANTPPTADAGADQTVDEETTVTLDGTGSGDADGDTLSYAWTQTAGPDVALSDVSAAQPTFTAPEVDDETTLTFELEVSDGTANDTDTVSVTVDEAGDGPPPVAPEGVTVSLEGEDADGEISVGQSTTFDVVVSGVDGGVGAFAVTVDTSDTSVATVTDAAVVAPGSSDDLATTEVDVTNSTATMEAALLDTEDTGNVTVGTVTLTGQSTGAAGVGLTVQALGNESGSSYVAEDVSGASLSVVQLPTVPGGEDTPGDADDDGVYEDVNGDGEVTVADVQALWDNRDDASITANAEFYDFNGDGTFDIVDVQALFDLVVN
jgi:hypothetical protein